MPVLSFLPEPGSASEAYTKRLASLVFACVAGSAFSAFFFSAAFGGDGVAWFLFLSGVSILAAPVVVLPLFLAERAPLRSRSLPENRSLNATDTPPFSVERPSRCVSTQPDLRVVSCATPIAGVSAQRPDLTP